MKKTTSYYIFATLLTVLPAFLVWTYIEDALHYQNSPHISTPWNKNAPSIYLDQKTLVRQSFTPLAGQLGKITLRIETGEGQYQWTIKKSLDDEALYTGVFMSNDVQNYDFINLAFTNPLKVENAEYWLEITRTDTFESKGIGLLTTQNNYTDGTFIINDTPHISDLVFQLYYSNVK